MRITAGTARGRALKVPKGRDVRPLLGRAKDVLFDTLGARIVGARVLDLYAGSGSVGLEALSRGADFVVFVDKNPLCVKGIRENLMKVQLNDRGLVVQADSGSWLKKVSQRESKFDMIFFDPPYRSAPNAEIVSLLGLILQETGLIVLKHHFKTKWSFEGLDLWKVKKVGDTQLTFLGRPLRELPLGDLRNAHENSSLPG